MERAGRLRQICSTPKRIQRDSGWQRGKLQPRHSPVFPKTLPRRPGWLWRSLQIEADDGAAYVLLFQCAADYGKWKAWLMTAGAAGQAELLIRIEDQRGKSGLHVHADCDGPGVAGPSGIEAGERFPPHDAFHRRATEWTMMSFFREACMMLRVTLPPDERQGTLL